MPWQALLVGAWANSQGHGMLQLQMSNQSPTRCHSGMLVIALLPGTKLARCVGHDNVHPRQHVIVLR